MGSILKTLRLAAEVVLHEPIVRSINGQHQLMKLLSSAFYGDLLVQSPGLTRQYFTSHLAGSLTLGQRREAVVSHYRFLRTHQSAGFYDTLMHQGVMLWRNGEVGGNYHIGLRHNVSHFYEGDLLLAFYRQDILLFQLSFSVIPGSVVGESADHVLFVGGGQGAAPERGELQPAVKAHYGVAPSHVAYAALQGVALGMRIATIIGVGNDGQLLKLQKGETAFTFDYDAFWAMFGAARNEGGHWSMPVPGEERPPGDASAAHRRRSRRKRAFKIEVRDAVHMAMSQHTIDADARPATFPGETVGGAQPWLDEIPVVDTSMAPVRDMVAA
ncbi:hypothetical protein ASG67_06885 [Sphingomonas sp. Leaf339]|uniref:DUF535 family protein n=1 Tax=Sphingomonas sp. Leaf339 TaxID=1736343 RepID=UPI0006F9317C|nr:DUF535 family protein [Sphingomonas sp. Leaf339]KQU55832.1 hypothetical protein ASG67_06885 [Sphingomonas sp. Leaf339]